jgi:hypothetical protein
MDDHGKFQLLCALAVTGQIGEADLRDLWLHLEGCGDCQDRIADFAQISAQALPLAGEKYRKPRSPKAMTARFMERARSEGIRLQEPKRLMPAALSFGALGWKSNVGAALLLIAIIAGIVNSTHTQSQFAGSSKRSQSGPMKETVIPLRAHSGSEPSLKQRQPGQHKRTLDHRFAGPPNTPDKAGSSSPRPTIKRSSRTQSRSRPENG